MPFTCSAKNLKEISRCFSLLFLLFSWSYCLRDFKQTLNHWTFPTKWSHPLPPHGLCVCLAVYGHTNECGLMCLNPNEEWRVKDELAFTDRQAEDRSPSHSEEDFTVFLLSFFFWFRKSVMWKYTHTDTQTERKKERARETAVSLQSWRMRSCQYLNHKRRQSS